MQHRIRPGHPLRLANKRPLCLAIGALCIGSASVQAAVTSSLVVQPVPATPLRYDQGGVTVTWGVGNDAVVQGFFVDERGFGRSDGVSRIALERGAAGESIGCHVFAERDDQDGVRLAPSFPSRRDRASDCDVRRILQSGTVNRGVLDLFANRGVRAGNVERADFIFNRGALAPFDPSELGGAGHPVAERGGDSPVRMAAILELDDAGRPSRYGPSVLIGAAGCTDDQLCFVPTMFSPSLALLQSPEGDPQGAPLPVELAEDTLAMAFVSSERLGLRAGQRYHGYSLFAHDVHPDQVDLTDPDGFPTDTVDAAAAAGGGLDLYGGLSGYFVDNDLVSAIGTVFLDTDGNGVPNEGDAGVADIRVTLYRDADGDGTFDAASDTLLSDGIDSDTGGVVRFHGLPDGTYFLVMDDGDEDMPGGLVSVPGSNPNTFVVSGDADVGPQYFPLQDGNGGTGGTGGDDGGDGAGGDDAADGGDGADGGDDASDGGDGADGGDDAADGGDGAGGGDDAADGGDGADGGDDAADGGDGADGGDDAADGGDGAGGGDDAADGGDGAGGGDDAAGGGDGADGGDDAADGGDGAGGGDDAADGGDGADGGDDAADGGDGADDGNGTGGGSDGGGSPDRDDSLTTAVPDRFTINQGTVLDADVLANDTDEPGRGLTIVAVGGSDSADVSIQGDSVRYAPDPGFVGTDSFTYTVRDSEGEESSAAVTVSVLRFSDINGNNLNDGEECEAVGIVCDDLTLETGVHGSGIGGGSLGWILLLGPLAWARRRVRRAGPETRS